MTSPTWERCAGCGRRVAHFDPGTVLEDLTTGAVYRYHEHCGAAALDQVRKSAPEEWRLTVRHSERWAV